MEELHLSMHLALISVSYGYVLKIILNLIISDYAYLHELHQVTRTNPNMPRTQLTLSYTSKDKIRCYSLALRSWRACSSPCQEFAGELVVQFSAFLRKKVRIVEIYSLFLIFAFSRCVNLMKDLAVMQQVVLNR